MTRRLGDILLQRRLISPQALDHALREQQQTGELLGQALIRLGYLTEQQLLEGLAEHLELPIVRLAQLTIDRRVMQTVPARLAWHYRCMPVRVSGKTVTLAMSDPLQGRLLNDLRERHGLEAQIVLATEADIQAAIQRCYGVGTDPTGEILEASPRNGPVDAKGAAEPAAGIERAGEDASVNRLVDQLLVEATRARASDVHLEPFRDALQIRYRIDGRLVTVPVPDEVRQFHPAIVEHLKNLSGLDPVETRRPQEGCFRATVGQEQLVLRMSIMPSLHGENVVLHLGPITRLLHLEQLGLLPDDLHTLEQIIAKPRGVVFVTGPEGSGTTTTLYACLARLNTPDRKIVALEYPVEYELKGVTQIPVAPTRGFSFREGQRRLLRHDADVVMVGEVVDHESADLTLRMALAGHLVFATLPTSDAVSGVTRLLEWGIEPPLMSSTILAFLAQRLVRLICPDCKGTGCEACRMSGYRGRTGIYELLVVDETIRRLMMENSPVEKIRARLLQQRWKTLRQDGSEKVALGQTTPEEILRVTSGA